MDSRVIQLTIVTNGADKVEAIDNVAMRKGWRLLTCIDPMQAIELLNSQQIDLVLLDLAMPNATAFIGELHRQLPHIPIIVVATSEHLVELQNAFLAGAADFVAFPINDEHFGAVVERALQERAHAMPQAAGVPQAAAVNNYAPTYTQDGVMDPTVQTAMPGGATTPPPPPPASPPPASPPSASPPPVSPSSVSPPPVSQSPMPQQGAQSFMQMSPETAMPFSNTALAPIRRSRIIAVTSLRGGVGRSTIAANLAIAVNQRNTGSVVLSEAHHGLSHLALMLQLRPRHTISTLSEESELDLDIIEGYLQSHSSGLKILSAPTHLADLVELSGETWEEIFVLLREVAPYVILDTLSAADAVLTETLFRADDIIVVTDPEIASLRSTTELLKSLQHEENINGDIHVVLNRSGLNGGLDDATIRKQIGYDIAVSLPDDPSLATYSLNRGVPFVLSHPRAVLSKRINALANHLFDDLPISQKPAKSSNPLFALFSR